MNYGGRRVASITVTLSPRAEEAQSLDQASDSNSNDYPQWKVAFSVPVICRGRNGSEDGNRDGGNERRSSPIESSVRGRA